MKHSVGTRGRTRASAVAIGVAQLALTAVALAAGGPAAPGASPPAIDVDAFQRLKRTVSLPNGMTLGYLELGAPAGPPVVLVHGYTDSALDWVPLVPYLDPAFRLILVDIRGHGLSAKPECCYARIDFAYDIKLLLDGLGIGRADLVGHSLGGVIVQTLAEYWPDRTRRVVLISTPGGPPPAATPSSKHAEPATLDWRAQIPALRDPIDPDSQFMTDWWSSPTPVNENIVRQQRRQAAAMPARVWLAVLGQALAFDDLQGTLPRLTAPVLLISGARDTILSAEERGSLHRGLPGARVVVYPELGHNSFWEDPGRVARDINAFLRD